MPVKNIKVTGDVLPNIMTKKSTANEYLLLLKLVSSKLPYQIDINVSRSVLCKYSNCKSTVQ